MKCTYCGSKLTESEWDLFNAGIKSGWLGHCCKEESEYRKLQFIKKIVARREKTR